MLFSVIELTMGNNCCKIFDNKMMLQPEDGSKTSLLKKPTDLKTKFEELN